MIESIYQDGRRYDAMTGNDQAAISFWIDQMLRIGGAALELAAGTGHFLLPALAAGVDIIGLDLSDSMLTEARRKADSCAHNPRLVIGDMRTFHLDAKFRMTFIAGNALSHLLTNHDLQSCLQCVRRNIEQDGKLLIDMQVPDVRILSSDSHKRFPFASYVDPSDGVEVVMDYSAAYDPSTQINCISLFTRRSPLPEQMEHIRMRMYFPQELDAHLSHNGFAVDRKFGNYHGEPFGKTSKRQLIIATAL
jgi:SAM-dependent methyltransferase